MSPGEKVLDHAERHANDVSSDVLPRSQGETGVNGVDSRENSNISARAGPSQPRSARSAPSPSPPQQDTTPKVPTKRRRLDAELAFSSPGPAFQLEEQQEDSEGTGGSNSGRVRRPRRSAALADGNTHGPTVRAREGRPSSVSSREAEPSQRKEAVALASSSYGEAKSAQDEVAQCGLSIASTGSDLLARSRSRSKSATRSEPDRNSLEAAEIEREDDFAPTIATTIRAKPQITPLTALETQVPLPEILDQRKREKVELAQAELEDVNESHDMLVRELFHLTKFVTMVGYDPDVARDDQSDVFTTFKHAHDLRFSLDESGSGVEASTPGRITRRRVNARLESLSLKRPQPTSSSPTPTTTKSKSNNSRHAPESGRSRGSSSNPGFMARSSVPNDSHGEDSSGDEDDVNDEESDDSDLGADDPRSKEKRKARARDARQKRSSKQSTLSARSKKRSRSVAEETSSDAPVKHIGSRKNRTLDELDAFILRHRPRPLPDHPPPPHFLAPHQVPMPRRFGGDLDALWHSFDLLYDGEGGRETGSLEEADVQTYIKLDERMRSGLPIRPEAGSTMRHTVHKVTRSKSHHDHLLEAVASSYSQMRQYARTRQQNSRKVARMVAQHWERRLGTSDREKKAEEKRVRALAKWTLREVLKQWRLAVNVIRARKAAAEKAEKEKLDKEQLNAILEQSTAMLKKQHQSMTQADSLVDSDSDIESDRTSYGSDGTAEPDEADIEDEASGETPDIAEAEGASSEVGTSTPVAREHSIASRPVSHGIDASLHHASTFDEDQTPITDDGSPALSAASPRESRRLRRRAREMLEQTPRAENIKLDPDDVEFTVSADNAEQEDAELERQMWEDDEEDDSEDAGLEADANIPIEELLKRYGYGQDVDQGTDEDHGTDEDAASEIAASEDARESSTKPNLDNMDTESETTKKEEAADVGREQELQVADSPNIEMDVAEDAASRALVRQTDAVLEDHSDTESAATSDRQSGRRSMTRASSVVSSDRQVARSRQPFLLRGQLRPYQQIGFEWLSSLYANGVNGILADEMGLGKTIQTISLLAHLACDKGVWGPHLVVAPTSVMLNWEVEFKKFLPGFKILSYYGNQKERKEKRIGWNTENSFNVCITSYQLVLADQHIFRRKPWIYLVLDEAHHIKNFRSQRWQTLLGFNSQRRLLLTGTPLQNNLMDLWSLMYFLMPHGVTDLPGGGAFANMKDFQDWFSNPLNKAIEGGTSMNEETRAMVLKLHAVLRPYLLRRLKSEVEKELPSKYEHVITCRLSKRQRFLYNDFMSRAKTRESLASGNYLSIINCLMQLRKVCNHPDLFEVRPIVTSFAMSRSVVADYEIKDLLVRRQLLREDIWDSVDLDVTNFRITGGEQHLTAIESRDLRRLNAAKKVPYFRDAVPIPPQLDTWTLDGFAKSREQRRTVAEMGKWKHVAYLNQYRCTKRPIYGSALIRMLREAGAGARLEPLDQLESDRKGYLSRCDNLLRIVQSRSTRRENMQPLIDRFAFVTPRAVATDMPRWALPGFSPSQHPSLTTLEFDTIHPVAVKLHIAFPDASLLQYDCGKLQQLDLLMRRLKEGGHRILIFTQMTRVLDILESFLNYHGYRYLRLDGATKVEQRQALTEKFNRDLRISAFILSTRSGGLGINLTGADTVLFYDLDWNAAIEAQCMDRAHRIGQTRDVHIYRFVTEHTIEENMLRKANQKRLLDNVVIQEGEFNTETLAKRIDWRDMLDDGGKLGDVEVGLGDGEGDEVGGREVERAFLEAEDEEDRQAALKARAEMFVDDEEFGESQPRADQELQKQQENGTGLDEQEAQTLQPDHEGEENDENDEGGTIDDYMLAFVERDWDFFA